MDSLPPQVSFPETPADNDCPNCRATNARAVYAVDSIPIHSCVLLDSSEEARAFPVGDMRWAYCPDCTFLFNDAFEPALIDYSSDYEETQGFSRTFSTWLEGVATDLIARYDLTGKRIVEIGCGRGDFLELICRLGDNTGVGVDPSETAGRVDHAAGAGLSFLREHFGPQHRDLEADAIVCRHTLEHIHDPRALLESVRAAIGDEGIVFFEVPDVGRQLDEGAFWDIYYEHCSYFSEASLRHLFESSGFTVVRIEKVYAGQYLQIAARPTAKGRPPAARSVDASIRAHWASAVATFSRNCESALGNWNRFLQERLVDHESAVLWGSGSKATGFLTTL
ncbi:MAG: SAM-dependent methyltransferase, partial [Gammaproteobacteria bacterium]